MNKQSIVFAANLALKPLFRLVSPQPWVMARMRALGLRFVDLGGYWPAEEYVSVRLSPVDFYGIPKLEYVTSNFSLDDDRAELVRSDRRLASPALSIVYDVSRGLPFDDGSIAGINMSHMLEHFSRKDGLRLLGECLRVLELTGAFRISCPDLRRYAVAYANNDAAFFAQTDIRWVNRYQGLKTLGDRFIGKAYDNDLVYGHKWFYDAESAMLLAREAGFSRAEERALHDSTLPNIASVEPAYRGGESFYVEAYK